MNDKIDIRSKAALARDRLSVIAAIVEGISPQVAKQLRDVCKLLEVEK